MKTNFLFIFVVLLFTNCKNATQTNLEKFAEKYNLQLADKKVVLIIPLDGCGICIEGSIEFIKQNIHAYTHIYYIASALGNNPISFKFEKQIIENQNFVADSDASAVGLQLCSTAPVAYFLENGKIAEAVTLITENTPEILQKIENLASDTD